MANTFTVTANVKCWKVHKCLDCGCEYRYRFERKIQGQGNSEKAAHQAANKKVEKIVDTEVDVRPCPTCGRVQPDMIGQVKAASHARMGGFTIPIVALVIILGATYVLGGDLPAIIVAVVFALAAFVNFLIAVRNPNRDRAENLARVERLLEAGGMEVVTEGKSETLEAAPSPMGLPHLLGIGIGVLAVGVALAPVLFKSMNNLPTNDDTKPDVVSPGETVKVYFPNRIDCVKSNWSGSATAEVLNENELGGPISVRTESNQSSWGNGMSVKSSEKHTHPTIWAKLTFPNEARLAGKTVKLRVTMRLNYPSVTDGNNFVTRNDTATKEFDIALAPNGAGSRYGTIWTAGLILASLMSVGASFYLRSLAKQLQRHAIRPIVETIGED